MADDPRTTEAITGTTPPRALVRECRLVILDGERAGAVHQLALERMVIGADPKADVPIDDTTLSKFHCEVAIREGQATVRDLGSRNGTFIDRVQVIEAPLRDGAILTLGRTRIRFELGARHVELPVSARDSFGKLRGGSIAMRTVYARLESAASGASTVLLQGESGTGKDLAAESIHLESARRDGPFIVVDCGAIPAHLLEDELFGHEAGAFTGANTKRIGAFEAASGGTLFLDEMGELALDLQPKLLRALDRREIQRIGSTQRIAVDVRIIAATNRRLEAEVNARRFRADLYYRLAVLVVQMPPLRDRMTDLPVLVEAILDTIGDRTSPMARALAGGELAPELMRHAWPGNVRELRNFLEACIVRQELAEPQPVTSTEPVIDISQPLRVVRDRWIRHVERRYLAQLLEAHGGNVSAAARAAGLDRVHFHRLLKAAGLR